MLANSALGEFPLNPGNPQVLGVMKALNESVPSDPNARKRALDALDKAFGTKLALYVNITLENQDSFSFDILNELSKHGFVQSKNSSDDFMLSEVLKTGKGAWTTEPIVANISAAEVNELSSLLATQEVNAFPFPFWNSKAGRVVEILGNHMLLTEAQRIDAVRKVYGADVMIRISHQGSNWEYSIKLLEEIAKLGKITAKNSSGEPLILEVIKAK